METSITHRPELAATACPPHAWITLRTTTSCSRCGLIRAADTSVIGRPLPSIPATLSTDPELIAVALEGETAAGRAARLDALADIATAAGEHQAAAVARSADFWLYLPTAAELHAVGGWAA